MEATLKDLSSYWEYGVEVIFNSWLQRARFETDIKFLE